MPPEISIPEDLLPADGRFGSGPSRVPQASLDAIAEAAGFMGTSHRKATVKDVVARIRTGLADLYELPDGYEVVMGIGGATAFWDAAVFGLIERRSAHFVCGEFSSKFAAVASGAPHLDEPVVIAADPGSAPIPEPIADIDSAAYIHNETSTGVLAPFARFGEELVLVDGTSAAGAVTFDVNSVDAYYFSPQKAFGSEGGLWIALMSPKAIERARSVAESDRWIPPFLSITTAIDNSLKDQTYNTPALATLLLLDLQIRNVQSLGGLGAAETMSRASTNHLYGWAEESAFAAPFVRDPLFRSPTVATIDFDDTVDANEIAAVLRSNGIVDTESYRKLGRNQLRIAAFPTIPTSDIEALTNCIDYVIAEL